MGFNSAFKGLNENEKGSNFQAYFDFEIYYKNKAGYIRTENVHLEPKCVCGRN